MYDYYIQHAQRLSNHWETSNDGELKDLYLKAMIASYLSNMCIRQISTKKSGANAYLISEHCIKTKTKTKQLLQRYADPELSYKTMFPFHRREAIDHFEV